MHRQSMRDFTLPQYPFVDLALASACAQAAVRYSYSYSY